MDTKTVILDINKFLINKIIDSIYDDNIPKDYILKHIIVKLHNNADINSKLYKIYNIQYLNNKKCKTTSEYIYEYITFINDYSPMLEYYNRHNIESEITDESDSVKELEYIKLEELYDYRLECGLNKNLRDAEDIKLLNFVDDILNNYNYENNDKIVNKKKRRRDNYNLKLLYLIHINCENPHFEIGYHNFPKNIILKNAFNT
jgi:hypothetical protein